LCEQSERRSGDQERNDPVEYVTRSDQQQDGACRAAGRAQRRPAAQAQPLPWSSGRELSVDPSPIVIPATALVTFAGSGAIPTASNAG